MKRNDLSTEHPASFGDFVLLLYFTTITWKFSMKSIIMDAIRKSHGK